MTTPARKIKIDLFFTPAQLDEQRLKEKNIVVIDVLRSSTTITAALNNGAREIIPVRDIESAMKMASSLDADVVLRGGERAGKMIEGFNLGNSPIEYTPDAVRGKAIILLTTNGTPAMAAGKYARNLFIASFVNLSSTVEHLSALPEDVTIICSGKEHRFAIEDAVCAGKIVAKIVQDKPGTFELDDAATAAVALDKAFGKNVKKMLKTSEHGGYLASIGFGGDVEFCGELDSIPVVPMLAGGVIKLPRVQVLKTA
jgi:2-phosphosulfolactate phosphatase